MDLSFLLNGNIGLTPFNMPLITTLLDQYGNTIGEIFYSEELKWYIYHYASEQTISGLKSEDAAEDTLFNLEYDLK